MQQSRVIPSPRSFACDLATLCAPTLAGLKPASLFRYQPAPGQCFGAIYDFIKRIVADPAR